MSPNLDIFGLHPYEAMTIAWPVWIVSSMANLDNAWNWPRLVVLLEQWWLYHCMRHVLGWWAWSVLALVENAWPMY